MSSIYLREKYTFTDIALDKCHFLSVPSTQVASRSFPSVCSGPRPWGMWGLQEGSQSNGGMKGI